VCVCSGLSLAGSGNRLVMMMDDLLWLLNPHLVD
jgi:hypothetical protein